MLLLGTKWYGVVALPRSADRSGIQSAVSGWSELSVIRWMIVASVLVTLGSVALHLSQRSHGTQTDTGLLVAAVGTVTAFALGYRVLLVLPASHSVIDAKLGAYLAVLAASGIALGGFESILAQRRRRRLRTRRRPRGAAALAPRAAPR